jgi:ribosomal protein L37AE/L43A
MRCPRYRSYKPGDTMPARAWGRVVVRSDRRYWFCESEAVWERSDGLWQCERCGQLFVPTRWMRETEER